MRLSAIGKHRLPLLVLTAWALALPCEATPVRWYLTGVTMEDGAVATGSFVYDVDTNTYSQININTSGGSIFGPAHYAATAPVSGVLSHSARAILVIGAGLPDYYGTPALALYPASPLSNAGGTINLIGSSLSISFETTCGGFGDCDGPGFVRRNFVSGVVTTAAPIPAAGPFGLALLAMLLVFSSTFLLRRAA